MGYEYGKKLHAVIDTDSLSVLKEILGMEYIWDVKYRNYNIAGGEIIVTYNCIVMIDKIRRISERKILFRHLAI